MVNKREDSALFCLKIRLSLCAKGFTGQLEMLGHYLKFLSLVIHKRITESTLVSSSELMKEGLTGFEDREKVRNRSTRIFDELKFKPETRIP